MAAITIKYEKSDVDVAAQGYKLRMTAHSAVGMSRSVFVLQAIPGGAGRTGDEFNRIANITDMEELPEAAPNGANPYYRVSEVELYFLEPTELEQAKAATNADVTALVDAINRPYAEDVEEDVRYGD